MLEEAQKRAAATAAAAANGNKHNGTNGQTPNANGSGSGFGTGSSSERYTNSNGTGSGSGSKQPPIAPVDLTLIIQFPPSSSTPIVESEDNIQESLSAKYGPISDILIKSPPQEGVGEGSTKKKSKKKGRKVIVEFKEGNWGGCWSCWKDIENGNFRGIQGQEEGEGEGVKVKWAGGEVPKWVEWATNQPHPRRTPHPNPNPNSNSQASTLRIPSPTSNPSFNPGTNPVGAPSFGFTSGSGSGSIPDFTTSTMSDLLSSHTKSRDEALSRKKQEQDFESMTLLRMRQMERERLAEQIRREEEED